MILGRETFEAGLLGRALTTSFAARGTPVADLPIILGFDFAADAGLGRQWDGDLRRTHFAAPEFPELMTQLDRFYRSLGPPKTRPGRQNSLDQGKINPPVPPSWAYSSRMHGLRELLLPLAVLQDASERDRSLIAALELAALSGQPVVLPPKTGRVSLRVKQAALQASERARAYQQWLLARPAALDPDALATELPWPYWEYAPEVGEVVDVAGQRYQCLDMLRASADDGSEGDSLILVLALRDDEFDLD